MQDRDGAALVLNKIRNRFPWLQLVWAERRSLRRRRDRPLFCRLHGLAVDHGGGRAGFAA
jgi:hypothetical protein